MLDSAFPTLSVSSLSVVGEIRLVRWRGRGGGLRLKRVCHEMDIFFRPQKLNQYFLYVYCFFFNFSASMVVRKSYLKFYLLLWKYLPILKVSAHVQKVLIWLLRPSNKLFISWHNPFKDGTSWARTTFEWGFFTVIHFLGKVPSSIYRPVRCYRPTTRQLTTEVPTWGSSCYTEDYSITYNKGRRGSSL